MNDKIKKIIIIVIISVISFTSIVLSGTTIYYKRKYDKSVECYRQLIDESRRRSEQYELVYQSARRTNQDIRESLSRCQYSIDELRNALRVIRERYEEMEGLLSRLRGNDNNIDGSGDNNSDSL